MRYLISILLITVCVISYADTSDKHNYNGYVEDTIQSNVEINHFHDEVGRLIFDQILFYDFKYDINKVSYEDNLKHVREWRLVKDGRKVYTSEEHKAKLEAAKEKWFEEQKIPKFDQDRFSLIQPWVPEYGYSQLINIDVRNKVVIIQDGEFLRKIHFNGVVDETWTQHDPELIDRGIVPKEKRIPFKVIKVKPNE